VSVYGTERAFIDGDDTPWSKAFLSTAYASRGIKARCTSGAGSELLMGFHSAKSMLYLEARCLCLQRGMGVQGTQNGGIDARRPARDLGGECAGCAAGSGMCVGQRHAHQRIRNPPGRQDNALSDVRHGSDLLRLRLDPEVR